MRSPARKPRASTPKRTKRRGVLFLVAALAAAAALSAVTFSSNQSRAASGTAQASSSAKQTPRAQGSVVVRDPETGQLRDATPEELLELQGQGVAAASVPEPIVSAQGISGLRLGDEQMTFTVATRNADGTVGIAHAAGKTEAERQVRAGARGPVAGKEQVLER